MERKVIDIYAGCIDKPSIVLTYNLRVDNDVGNKAEKVQCWIRQDKLADFQVLLTAQTLLRNLLLASGNQLKSVNEKEIFTQYQRAFASKKWNAIGVRTEQFNTARLAIFKKPYRDFDLATKDFIDKQIPKIITTQGE